MDIPKKADAKDIPKNPITRRVWVGSQLKYRNTSYAQIARQEGVKPQSVYNAMLVSSSHLEKVLASALGLKVEELFPERFDETGQRIGYTRPPLRIRKSPMCPVENVEHGHSNFIKEKNLEKIMQF